MLVYAFIKRRKTEIEMNKKMNKLKWNHEKLSVSRAL